MPQSMMKSVGDVDGYRSIPLVQVTFSMFWKKTSKYTDSQRKNQPSGVRNEKKNKNRNKNRSLCCFGLGLYGDPCSKAKKK
jgi:hypothetical protein